MKSMNLFGGNDKSNEVLFGNSKPKEIIKPKETTNQSLSAPIQDEDGNITFELEGKTYSLNVNSKEERERVKEEVNANSLTKYDWFKEETGEKHWAFYNTEMYEVEQIYTCDKYIHYKENSNLNPVIPVNATSCYYMFYGCYKLNQLDLSNFDTSNITDMCGMFYGCKSLSQLDISNFDTSQVTTMFMMFSNCLKLTQLDLSNFDTSNVTEMSYMFDNCLSLTRLDLSNFDTSNVTTMCGMFSCCKKLTMLDLSSFNTSQVTDMCGMLEGCHCLSQLDISNFNTREVTRTENMFYYCIRLTTIYISNKWNLNKVINAKDMFKECYSLPNFNSEKIDAKMAKPIEEGGYLTLKK